MTWLVTGGAGYIGSHVVRAFAARAHPGRRWSTTSPADTARSSTPRCRSTRATSASRSVLERIFTEHEIAGVVHLAGFKYAGVSVSRPLHTYTQNVTAMIALLDAMAGHGVDRFVFSSSAAVFGTPDTGLVTEANPTRPESPYGESKLIGEWLLRRPGPGDRRGPRLPAHLAALLQRRRVRLPRPARHQPAQPVPADLRAAGGRQGPRTSTATTTPLRTGPASATTYTCPISPLSHVAAAKALTAGRPAGAGLQPGQRHRPLGPARSWMPSPGSPASTSPPRSGPGAPVTRPRSWPPVSWPVATWTGGCGTRRRHGGLGLGSPATPRPITHIAAKPSRQISRGRNTGRHSARRTVTSA